MSAAASLFPLKATLPVTLAVALLSITSLPFNSTFSPPKLAVAPDCRFKVPEPDKTKLPAVVKVAPEATLISRLLVTLPPWKVKIEPELSTGVVPTTPKFRVPLLVIEPPVMLKTAAQPSAMELAPLSLLLSISPAMVSVLLEATLNSVPVRLMFLPRIAPCSPARSTAIEPPARLIVPLSL